MPVSILDSRIFSNLFGTASIRAIFSDASYASYLISVETALARAQSHLGVIPAGVGAVLTQACDAAKLDLVRLGEETEIVGYPILPLIRQLGEMCPAEEGKYIHWGATTQDIMDMATVLQIDAGLGVVSRELESLEETLIALADKHRDTPMAGRTHLQHALPVTFGYKCAVWLSSVQRHRERLLQIGPRCLLVQFGGAAGTLASLGADETGLKVRAQLARELRLKDPPITWHVARDNIAEIVSFLALVGGSLAKIALDVILMSANELGEVSEPYVLHRGASSTMPQKRNPISSEVVIAASKMLRANAGLALDAMVSDFERASGPWHLEWAAVGESFVLLCGALHQTNFALSGLVVHEIAMRENLASTKGLIVGEAVMMGLAPFLGRQAAHDLVYESCRRCVEDERPLAEVLLDQQDVIDKVGEEKIRYLCDPLNYLGASALMVDETISRSQQS
jgi:3-carboxy-cis,cis-muconate cycloisomerase